MILADEPTGNLDAAMGAQALELMLELARQSEHSLILATHSHQIASLADRILTIEDCRLVPEEREMTEPSPPIAAGAR